MVDQTLLRAAFASVVESDYFVCYPVPASHRSNWGQVSKKSLPGWTVEKMHGQEPRQELAIYVGLPFCKANCAFCDLPHLDCVPAHYRHALLEEMQRLREYEDGELPVRSIYIGGGDIHIVDHELIEALFHELKTKWRLTADCEITVECNGTLLKKEEVDFLVGLGATRLSCGVQTYNEALLRKQKRGRPKIDVLAYAAEKTLLNIDLIYLFDEQVALGNLGLDILAADIRQSIAIGCEHICPSLLRKAHSSLPRERQRGDYAFYKTAVQLYTQILNDHGFHLHSGQLHTKNRPFQYAEVEWRAPQACLLGVGLCAQTYAYEGASWVNPSVLNGHGKMTLRPRGKILTAKDLDIRHVTLGAKLSAIPMTPFMRENKIWSILSKFCDDDVSTPEVFTMTTPYVVLRDHLAHLIAGNEYRHNQRQFGHQTLYYKEVGNPLGI